ncbi:nucleotidyl transferase AbiEii/AbiGii toxin family protein [Azospirillum soli]|uniref:nucleotidyl transferase AbiEii/AbiGii toxin family protein n=1 Tax=Azospirillum soli TaxID=1304799 RepID=UPI001AEB613C|nr:nucleotidyl transferase AbiEii/AbiGii toxin family protein [Azospirillum soli]MBP2311515.1 hypothetical protein [Azospirillum soli]
MTATAGFLRPEHDRIADALASMNADLLLRCRCFFGGGTAIVLKNGEYRLSLDVDFLCSDVDGYRTLRIAAVEQGARAFFGEGIETVREFRTDQYGLRAVLAWEGQRIKFEIVREGRIDIDGALDHALGVPLLSVEDQFAEKLLANADRCLDKSIAYRDAIDLGYLVKNNGGIPSASLNKVDKAYGRDVPRNVERVLRMLTDPAEVDHAAETLRMKPEEVWEAAANLSAAATVAWPEWSFALPSTPQD